MKFQPDTIEGVNVITRHEAGRIAVGSTAYAHSVIVPWVGEVLDWRLRELDELTPEHVERLIALRPELVIFGSGSRMRFAPSTLLRPLVERRIGIESMDTAAACRTYNVLASERRSVVAALIVAPAAG